jgi:hypothetical protein
MRTLSSYGPILHSALKATPSQREQHQNCEMPSCGHTSDTLREGGLTPTSPPTDTLYHAGRYGSALVELNSAVTLRSVGWCVRKGPVKRSVHSISDRGELISSKRK